MPTNSSQYGKAYMKDYIKNCPVIVCECGGKYRKYSKYKHEKTKKHQQMIPVENIKLLTYEPTEIQRLKDRLLRIEERLNKPQES